jgi:hypothetical protein
MARSSVNRCKDHRRTVTGDDAEISVQGTMLLQREEPTGDIVEVDRYPVKGTVKLQRKDGVWRYAGTEKLEK